MNKDNHFSSPVNQMDQPASRKVYQPPRLERVQLVPDQAVLGNCLSSSETGPSGTGCGFNTLPCSSVSS